MSIPPQSDLDKMILGEGKGCLDLNRFWRNAMRVRLGQHTAHYYLRLRYTGGGHVANSYEAIAYSTHLTVSEVTELVIRAITLMRHRQNG